MTTLATTEPKSGSPSAFKLLNMAALHLGVPTLARALSIEERSVRAKLGGDRGVHNDDLALAADALRKRAAAMLAQADAIDARLGVQ